jgi:hypothetical protein
LRFGFDNRRLEKWRLTSVSVAKIALRRFLNQNLRNKKRNHVCCDCVQIESGLLFSANHAFFDAARGDCLRLQTIQTRVFALYEGQAIQFLVLKLRYQPAAQNSSAKFFWFLKLEILA